MEENYGHPNLERASFEAYTASANGNRGKIRQAGLWLKAGGGRQAGHTPLWQTINKGGARVCFFQSSEACPIPLLGKPPGSDSLCPCRDTAVLDARPWLERAPTGTGLPPISLVWQLLC